MLAVDNIKIKYSQEGYLPNYPPHLISNTEMCKAFIDDSLEFQYFYDNYPLLASDLTEGYNTLVNAIKYHFCRFVTEVEKFYKDMPDWVYSYMLNEVVSNSSLQEDRHYFLVGIGTDNIDDIMTPESQIQCYQFSQSYVNKLDKNMRIESKPAMLEGLNETETETVLNELESWGIQFDEEDKIVTRPPTMFGEPHVIKLIRINEVG